MLGFASLSARQFIFLDWCMSQQAKEFKELNAVIESYHINFMKSYFLQLSY